MNKFFKRLFGLLVQKNARVILLSGLLVSLFEFSLLYFGARSEGVLFIDNGVGLLQNFGLMSTLIGDAFLFFFVKKYSDCLFSITSNNTIYSTKTVYDEIKKFKATIYLQNNYKYVFYLFVLIGSLAWVSNTTFHLLGQAESHWGNEVFDSIEYPLGFTFNRLNNFYSWMIVLPICLYGTLVTTVHLFNIAKDISKKLSVRYDLLNPDKYGGFSFIEKAHIYYNFLIAIIYIQIVFHIITFDVVNLEHIISFSVITLFYLIGNNIFINTLNGYIETLRERSLNKLKDEIYNNNSLSFEIFKYYQESFRKKPFFANSNTIVNITKLISISIPIAIKAIEYFT